MKILVLNSGSSSVKYQLFNMQQETVLAKGLVERIGMPGAILSHESMGKEKVSIETSISDHSRAIQMVLDALMDDEYGVIREASEIDAIGHRAVHGGSEFASSVLVNEKIKATIRMLFNLAPLHNPPGLKGIEA
ncbi:MAG TPA: acetate kinase, partial [Clostridia bacterium]|nr:acetate kinase [Clostridia bacterium]